MTREEATKWLKTFKGRTGMAELSQAFDVAIQALEQEPQTDEIILSKKEYRELLSDEFEHGYDKGLSDAITSLEQEPCTDAISREDALQALCKAVHKNDDTIPCLNQRVSCIWDKTKVQDYAKEILKLPSVKPEQKTGHWITEIKSDLRGDMWPTNPKCSECGGEPYFSKTIYSYNFCPYCGAKMVEPQESEDKE